MITDTRALPQSSALIPPLGQSYTDPIFGSSIRRITDALATKDNADGTKNLRFIVNEYSGVCPFNRDGSLLLLQHQGYFGLYNGAGLYLSDLPLEIVASTEPRWSRTNSRIVFYKLGNVLKSCDVLAGSTGIVHTFSEYSKINGSGESDLCWDGDHVVLVGDNRYVFVYTISSSAKGAVLDTAGRGFDSVYISADDQVTVTWNTAGTTRYNGIELFSKNMVFLRQLTHAGGHMDMGRDVNGDAVLIWANAADPQAAFNTVVKVRLADARHTDLLTLNWNLAYHISCDDQGHAVISTYRPDMTMPWVTYTNEIVLLTLDGSAPPARLVQHRSQPFNSYNWQPKGSISRDGKMLVFSSNFGRVTSIPEYSDVYMMATGVAASAPQAVPPPARDLTTELDTLKARVAALENTLRETAVRFGKV